MKAGLPANRILEELLFAYQSETAFCAEAILVFNRRFMLRPVFVVELHHLASRGATPLTYSICCDCKLSALTLRIRSLMHDPAVTTLAIVLTAIEECILRATMVDRDDFFHKWAGKAPLTSDELAERRIIWAVQTGNSMIIEIVAIIVHTVSLYFFLPHRFVFNLGYGSTEDEGQAMAAMVLSMLLELLGELITDHIAIYAETAHGVPIVRYFELLSNSAFVALQVGSLVCATGVSLWTFSRIPSATFCNSPDPCSCLDLSSSSGGSNFEIYREACVTFTLSLSASFTTCCCCHSPSSSSSSSSSSILPLYQDIAPAQHTNCISAIMRGAHRFARHAKRRPQTSRAPTLLSRLVPDSRPALLTA